MDIGEPEVAAGVSVRELLMVESQRMQQCCMKIMHVHFVGDGVMSEFVGFSIGDSGPESTSCNPY